MKNKLSSSRLLHPRRGCKILTNLKYKLIESLGGIRDPISLWQIKYSEGYEKGIKWRENMIEKDYQIKNKTKWISLIIFIFIFAFIIPDIARAGFAFEPDKGTLAYMFYHDCRWIFGFIMGILIGVLWRSSKGLLQSGKEELKEWRECKNNKNMD